jgi:hypothetical protein
MMVAVAIVGSVLGLVGWLDRRSRRFDAMSWDHFLLMEKWGEEASRLSRRADPGEQSAYSKADYHDAMGSKYYRAARSPWLPVEPDPPEP